MRICNKKVKDCVNCDNAKCFSNYRLFVAKEFLRDAVLLYKHNRFKSAISRAYYAIINMVKSVLALEGRLEDLRHFDALVAFDSLIETCNFINESKCDAISAIYNNSLELKYLQDFRRRIDTRNFRTKLGLNLALVFGLRVASDYHVFNELDKDDAKACLELAYSLLKDVRKMRALLWS